MDEQMSRSMLEPKAQHMADISKLVSDTLSELAEQEDSVDVYSDEFYTAAVVSIAYLYSNNHSGRTSVDEFIEIFKHNWEESLKEFREEAGLQ